MTPQAPSFVNKIRDSLPLAVLTSMFLFSWLLNEPLFGGDRSWLTELYMIEFLAVHSFPFVMILLAWRPSSDKTRGLRLFLVAFTIFFYSLAAHSIGRWQGVFELLPLIGGTYFGFLLRGIPRERSAELIARGVINTLLFIFCSEVFGLPSHVNDWLGRSDVVQAGALYFFILTILELTGVFIRLGSLKALQKSIRGADTPAGGGSLLPGKILDALLPLLGSFGLAFLPYFVTPLVAGLGARTIDDLIEWPESVHLIRYWYFALYVLSFAGFRTWQTSMIFQKLVNERLKHRLILSIWIVFAVAAGLNFFGEGRIVFSPWWTSEEFGWFLVPDILMLFLLIPFSWLAVGSRRSENKPA